MFSFSVVLCEHVKQRCVQDFIINYLTPRDFDEGSELDSESDEDFYFLFSGDIL